MAPDYRISSEKAEAFENFMNNAGFPYQKIEGGLEKSTRTKSGIILPTHYVNTDYVQFAKKDGKIANSSIGQFHGEKDWYDQNKATLSKGGLIVTDSAEGIAMYSAIIDAHLNGTKLYHPDKSNPFEIQKDTKGNILQEPVNPLIIKDLYKRFTQNNWQNLNNIFERNEKGILLMKKANGLDEDGNLKYSVLPIEHINEKGALIKDYLDRNGVLVNLKDFNEKGFVEKGSREKNFDKDGTVYWYAPKPGRAARLNSNDSDSLWNGDYVPDVSNGSLLVGESLLAGSEVEQD
ncbi:MAG: hypothetical protein PF542_04305 [Nanoarchaeota archaeon]|jgi:hypothetical protein|nr:hypothetical protein [Nanoarchaeota archaeon]